MFESFWEWILICNMYILCVCNISLLRLALQPPPTNLVFSPCSSDLCVWHNHGNCSWTLCVWCDHGNWSLIWTLYTMWPWKLFTHLNFVCDVTMETVHSSEFDVTMETVQSSELCVCDMTMEIVHSSELCVCGVTMETVHSSKLCVCVTWPWYLFTQLNCVCVVQPWRLFTHLCVYDVSMVTVSSSELLRVTWPWTLFTHLNFVCDHWNCWPECKNSKSSYKKIKNKNITQFWIH